MAERALPGRLEVASPTPEMPSADIDTTGLVSAAGPTDVTRVSAGPTDVTPQEDNDSDTDSDALEERALVLELKLIRLRIRMRARTIAARTPTRPTTPVESPTAIPPAHNTTAVKVESPTAIPPASNTTATKTTAASEAADTPTRIEKTSHAQSATEQHQDPDAPARGAWRAPVPFTVISASPRTLFPTDTNATNSTAPKTTAASEAADSPSRIAKAHVAAQTSVDDKDWILRAQSATEHLKDADRKAISFKFTLVENPDYDSAILLGGAPRSCPELLHDDGNPTPKSPRQEHDSHRGRALYQRRAHDSHARYPVYPHPGVIQDRADQTGSPLRPRVRADMP